jgi:hypothetical protein
MVVAGLTGYGDIPNDDPSYMMIDTRAMWLRPYCGVHCRGLTGGPGRFRQKSDLTQAAQPLDRGRTAAAAAQIALEADFKSPMGYYLTLRPPAEADPPHHPRGDARGARAMALTWSYHFDRQLCVRDHPRGASRELTQQTRGRVL